MFLCAQHTSLKHKSIEHQYDSMVIWFNGKSGWYHYKRVGYCNACLPKEMEKKKKRPNLGRRNCLTTLLMWLNIEQATPSGDAVYKSATFLIEPPMRVRHLCVTVWNKCGVYGTRIPPSTIVSSVYYFQFEQWDGACLYVRHTRCVCASQCSSQHH